MSIKPKSAETLIIERCLRDTQPGDEITYEELTRLLGRDVRAFCRGCLSTARNTLQGESVFFDTITNKGLLRLDNEGACKATHQHIDKSRRAARRGVSHLSNIPFAALTPETQWEHLAMSTQLGVIVLFASGKAEKRITSALTGSAPIPIGETLKLFGVKE